MDGWMDGWIDIQRHKQIHKQIERQIHHVEYNSFIQLTLSCLSLRRPIYPLQTDWNSTIVSFSFSSLASSSWGRLPDLKKIQNRIHKLIISYHESSIKIESSILQAIAWLEGRFNEKSQPWVSSKLCSFTSEDTPASIKEDICFYLSRMNDDWYRSFYLSRINYINPSILPEGGGVWWKTTNNRWQLSEKNIKLKQSKQRNKLFLSTQSSCEILKFF